MNSQFTDEAAILWRTISPQIQTRLINNVWCRNCGRATTITNFKGVVENEALILTGRCAKCGERVTRVIENE